MKPPRDPERISELLEAVEIVWRLNPDLRLAQLINNCSDRHNAYYMEDDVLLHRLQEVYKVPE